MDKFVLNVPKWQGELVFSKEVLIFVGVILLMIVGILFCFWGYKFFRTILFMGIGTAACYGSFLLVEPMTDNSVIRMFLTVSLTFFVVCFVYFLNIIWSFILDKLRIRTALGKRTYLLAAPLGAAILGLTIYYMIWRDAIVAGVIAAVCLIVGLPFQHSKRKKQIRFKSYDDLLKLSRPEYDEGGLEYISMGTAAAATWAVSKAESAPVEAIVREPEEEIAEPEEFVEAAVYEPEEEIAEPEEFVEAAVYESEEEIIEPELVETIVCEPEEGMAEPEKLVETAVYEPEEEIAEPEFVEAAAYEPEEKIAEPKKLVEAAYESEEEMAEPEFVEAAVYESEEEMAEPEFVEAAVYEPEEEIAEPKPVEPVIFAPEPELPEPESVRPTAFEPEPKFVEQAVREAKLKAAEPVKPAKPEVVEPVKAAVFQPSKIVIQTEVPSEIEMNFSESTLFLKQIKNDTEKKQTPESEAGGRKSVSSYLDKIVEMSRYKQNADKNQNQEWKLTGGVALMAFGLGFLLANKTPKGGD